MLYCQEGITETQVYSSIEGLGNWTITIQKKESRERVEDIISMTELGSTDTRYLLEWTCPVLTIVESTYEIKSGTKLIDKGILRRNGSI